MPRADIERFPKLIIEISEDKFPDKLKITMKGRKLNYDTADKTSQLIVEAMPGAFETLYDISTFTESSFKNKSADNTKKVAKLNMPYNDIVSISAWAHRDDFENNDPIEVNMYITTAGGMPSSSGNTYNLDGVWSYRFSLTKQPLTVSYCTEYLTEGTEAAQMITLLGNLVAQSVSAISETLLPKLPTPKAIASILLGPLAAPVQSIIARAAQLIAQYKPTIDAVLLLADAISKIAADPECAPQYIPVLFSFFFEFIPKEDIAEIIYDFKGGA